MQFYSITKEIRSLALLLMFFNVHSFTKAETAMPKSIRPKMDAICGPQALQQVLSFYGVKEDLSALVSEIQPFHRQAPATFDDLERALRVRKIHSSAHYIGPNVKLNWEYPVIFQAITRGGEGHFGVRFPKNSQTMSFLRAETEFLPLKDNCSVIWIGPKSYHEITDAKFSAIRTGNVLLTAPTDCDFGSAFSASWFSFSTIASALTACVALLASLCLWRFYR
jgi:hypothetical protein